MVCVGPAKNEALWIFSDPIPGYRIERVWLDSESVPMAENTGAILPGCEHTTDQETWRSAAARSTSQGRGG